MCGFAGLVQHSRVPHYVIESMGKAIAHRGPDYTGYYADDHASFVHNRLSLVDVSANGHQPFEDDTHVLVYNGEIYNHQELRHQYLPHIQFKSTSDTETLFHLLKQMPLIDCCRKLEGMFAFAWYSKQTHEVALVRDRLGIKPLFYSFKNNGLQFGSEQKALIVQFEYEIDSAKVLNATLGELEYTRRHTAFKDLYQLIPGTIITYQLQANTFQESAFFSLTDLVDTDLYHRLHKASDNELLDEFETIFTAGVNKMLMSDVPMGAFVSGGIDSSLIASIASASKPLQLFTADVKGKYSELKYSSMLAKLLQSPLHVHEHAPDDLVSKFVETIWYYGSPIVVHANAIPFQGVAKLARQQGVKAVLSGEGADELFLGYPRLLTRKWDKLIQLPFNFTTALYKKVPGLTRYLNLNKQNFDRDLLYLPFNMERQTNDRSYLEAFDFVKDTAVRNDHVLSLEMLGRGLHSLLWRNDRMGMMHGIEARFPFLDEQVLQFAINLPIHQKIALTKRFHNYKHPFLIDKYIVRKLAEKRLPNELIYRQKAGFPLYGILNMKVKTQFFHNGFLQQLLQLDNRGLQTFEQEADPYLKAKLACVEVWGRLFQLKEPMESIMQLVAEKIDVDTK